MNNFVFSQDPLLFQNPFPRQYGEEINAKQQMDDAYMKYKAMQEQYKNFQQKPDFEPVDRVKELNQLLTSLTQEEGLKLAQNSEYGQLNGNFQSLVQEELLNSIKWKINNNSSAEKNMLRQIEIIKSVKKECEDEERKNINELNDYMKNYSNMTFDEYKKIKNGDINNDKPKPKK